MDNLTHTLMGLMLARAGLDRTTPRGAGMMMLAANTPDIDVISWFGGTVTYLEYHRGYAHALASAPVLALIPMLLVRAKFRWRPYMASLIGVLSHVVLDCTNVYGVRMLLPFSARWIRLDITDIVDPWIWALLFLAIAAPALTRLVSSEIGERPGTGPRCSWARFALIALFAYEIARYAAHERALAVMNARLFGGAVARRITVLPNRWNPLLWRGVVEEAAGAVTIVPVDLAHDFDPTAGRTDYAPPPSPAIEAARREEAFRVLEWFDQLPFWKITPGVDGTVVELIDLRFGTPQRPGLEAKAIVDASGAVHDVELGFGLPR
jgi:inner membrane protein